MADADSVIKPKPLPLLAEKNQKNPPGKFTSHFLVKAVVVAIFLVVIQNFPSQAPEFINQTLLTRGWELLHLLFVGIAISYGLFSRKNDETEKEKEAHHSKFDNAQSYVSRFLQVSSVFDDENETSSGSEQETKFQTWSNQYYRNEPAVVVAQESSVLDDRKVTSSRISEKPLLLPVRSLKSRVVEADESPSPRSSSNLGPRRFSRISSLNLSKTRNDEFGGVGFEEDVKENVVLPSPIPWRSRSGRIEMKEEMENPPFYNLPPSMEESEFNKSFKPQAPRLSRPNSANSSPKMSPMSPKKMSPLPSMSMESQAKSAEDLVRKRNYYKTSSPPPPPPPMVRKSSSMKPSSTSMADGISFEKELRRSFTSDVRRDNSPRMNLGGEMKPRSYNDGSSMGKSVRTYRIGEQQFGSAWRGDDENGVINGKSDRVAKEVEVAPPMREKVGRKSVSFDKNAYWNHESDYISPRPTFMEFPEEEDKREYVEKFVVQSDGETDHEDDHDDEDNEDEDVHGGRRQESEEGDSNNSSDGAPDVDKKADEFIAKFREQIRLQRIESIKRTSAQISRNTSR